MGLVKRWFKDAGLPEWLLPTRSGWGDHRPTEPEGMSEGKLLAISRERDRELMLMAVNLSRQSKPEEDGRIHPRVGAVIVTPNGVIISTGYRGQHTRGNHAEQEALVGVREDAVAGAVVYSTLEPCTFRGKQTPCCLRLLDRQIAEVVIGILDPNRDIRGRGWWKFEERGVKVRNFDFDLVQEIREMNAAFINDQLGLGLMITQIQPEGAELIEVTPDHRMKRKILEVGKYKNTIRGVYRVRPQPGDSIAMFVRRDRTYNPQAPINFSFDQENRMWEIPAVWLGSNPEPATYEIIIARLSADLNVATRHYSDVHSATRQWVGLHMDPEPPGFERLASLTLRRAGN